jgi:hypothetical protein
LAVSGPNGSDLSTGVFLGLRDFLVGRNPHNVQAGELIQSTQLIATTGANGFLKQFMSPAYDCMDA